MKIERVQGDRCKFKDLPQGIAFVYPPEKCYSPEIPMMKTECVCDDNCNVYNAVALETGNLYCVESDEIVVPLKATIVIG